MNKILIIRLSALGDVSMTLPVIESVCKAYPDKFFTLLTNPQAALIASTIMTVRNFSVKGVNVKRDYKGIVGLFRLYNELRKEGYDAIVDLHDVLRTKVLRACFKLSLIHCSVIDKGRIEKKALVNHYINKQLKNTFTRYKEVFENLGMKFEITYNSQFHKELLTTRKNDNCYNVGIAPFAQHKGKQYPHKLMCEVVTKLLVEPQIHIYLYGGPEEKEYLDLWTKIHEGRITNYAGHQTLGDDLRSMANLDVMLTMDSSNMHMASLVGIRCVSIWGNTHPYAGFLGYGQKMEDVIQLDMPCRPCSIYGKSECKKSDYHCINYIEPNLIVEKIKRLCK